MASLGIVDIRVDIGWLRSRAPEFADLAGCSPAEAIGYAVLLWSWAYGLIDADEGPEAIERASVHEGARIVRRIGWAGDAAKFLKAASSQQARLLEDLENGTYRIRGLNRLEDWRQKTEDNRSREAARKFIERKHQTMIASGWRQSEDRKTWTDPSGTPHRLDPRGLATLWGWRSGDDVVKQAPVKPKPAPTTPVQMPPQGPQQPPGATEAASAPTDTPKPTRRKARGASAAASKQGKAGSDKPPDPSITLIRASFQEVWKAAGREDPLLLPPGRNGAAIDYGMDGRLWGRCLAMADQVEPNATIERRAEIVLERLAIAATLTKRAPDSAGAWGNVKSVHSLEDFAKEFKRSTTEAATVKPDARKPQLSLESFVAPSTAEDVRDVAL